MRIGEVAALAGVSTRTVRHYHDIGVLPEPERRPNGYREYSVLDVVGLLRVRHLVAIGLPLDTVSDLLDPRGTDIAAELSSREHVLRQQIQTLNRQLDAVLAAQRSALPEAPGRYDDLDESSRSALTEAAVRRIETDLALLVSAADHDLHQHLGARAQEVITSDPALVRRLVAATSDLLAVDAGTPAVERDRVAAELSQVLTLVGATRDLGTTSEPLLADYRDAAFTDAQRDVLDRVVVD